MAHSFGDVVLVPFPFTDQSGTKKRPAVIASSSAYNTGRLVGGPFDVLRLLWP